MRARFKMRLNRKHIFVISLTVYFCGIVRSDDVWRPKPKHSFQYTVVMDTSVMTIGGLLEAADGDLGLCGELLYRRSTRYCFKKDKTVRVKRCSHLCSGPLDRQLQDCKNRCPIYLLCMYGMKGQNDTLCQRFFDYHKPGIAGDDAEDGHNRNLEVTTHATEPAKIDDSNTVLGFLDVPEECRSGMRRLFMIVISVQITSSTVIFILFFVTAKKLVKGEKGFMWSNLSRGSSLQWNGSEESIIKTKGHQSVYTINKDGAVADEADDAGAESDEEEEGDTEAGDFGLTDSKITLDFTEEDCLILDKTITSDRNTDSHKKEAEVERKLREVE